MVVWIIGLSGSGKTTLAENIVEIVRKNGRPVVLLDGDQVRELFGNDLGHDLKDRFLNAKRICHLCAFLDSQGIDVVCAILSIFQESRRWCRENLIEYYEVFIDVPIKMLQKRDTKKLYARYARGEIKNVAGLDLDFPKPSNPDLVIKNEGPVETLLEYAQKIAEQIYRV